MDFPSRLRCHSHRLSWFFPTVPPYQIYYSKLRTIILITTLLLTLGSLFGSQQTAFAQDDPGPTIPDEVRSDLGDAPDSTNHHGLDNTAYPTVLGQFPTVWEDTTGFSGPKHHDVTLIWLGDGKTREFDADIMPDGDGVTNIVANGTADVANRDRGDDGWLNPDVPFINCQETQIKLRVAWDGPVTNLEHYYVNAWYDGNRDGDWDDMGECADVVDPTGAGARSFEWLLQDLAFNNPTLATPGPGFVDLVLSTRLVLNEQGDAPAWFRLMISDHPVSEFSPFPADGRGPPFPEQFRMGETEDYLTRKTDEPTADVNIRKTADVQVAQPGDTITYKIEVFNSGAAPALGYMVEDKIPAGTTYVAGSLASSAPASNYDAGTNTVKWNGDIPAGGTVTIEFQVTVNDDFPCGKTLLNVAVLISPNGETQRAVAEVKIECPDLQPPRITKKALQTVVAPGGFIDYEIQLANPNPVAVSATMIDPIPANTMYVAGSATADAPTVVYDGGPNHVKWGGTIPASGTVTIKFSVQVMRDVPCDSVIRNQAFLITDAGEEIGSQVIETKVECPQEPSIDIVKRAEQTIVGPGGIIDYVIVIYNGGAAPASVVMNDPIPAGTSYVPGSATASAPSVSYIGGSNAIQWSGMVPATGSVTIKFSVHVHEDIDCDSVIVNRAVAYPKPTSDDPSQPTPVPVEAQVVSETTTKIECPDVDLDIKKMADVATVTPGGMIEYTIQIINNGTSPAAGFTMVDVIPAGTTYVAGSASATAPNVAYDAPNNWVRWAGVIPAGGMVEVKFKVQVEDVVDCSSLIWNIAELLDGQTGALIDAARVQVKIECDNQHSLMDMGDAPDSTNHHGIDNTAYADGTLGRFDTVWMDQMPSGPAHERIRVYWLGEFNTEEADADLLPDADGFTNILANGAADVANRDRGDDGWLNREVPLINCETTKLRVRVAGSGAMPNMTSLYLNVWFDGNNDGDWQDTGFCQNQDVRSYEWIVQNYAVDVSTIAASGGFIDIDVPTELIYDPNADHSEKLGNWLRFTLSEREAVQPTDTPLPDGRGPNYPSHFRLGETEGYHVRPVSQGDPKLEIEKKADVNVTLPGGVITYKIAIHNHGTAPVTTSMVDPIPVGTTFVAGSESATIPAAAYNGGSNQIEWNGTIPAGGVAVIEFQVKVDENIECPTVIKNQAALIFADGTTLPSAGVLVRVLCPDPDPEAKQDLGDAPDSTFNHHNMDNTAYVSAGILGRYPTVWDSTPAGEPSGPVHMRAEVYWLGDHVTNEKDADLLPDADGITNILNSGTTDIANRDRADDGWLNPKVPLNNCERTTLRVRLSGAVSLPTNVDRLYLNVWQDGNMDGDWDDVGECSVRPIDPTVDPTTNPTTDPNNPGNLTPALAYRSFEWIVQDYVINPAMIPAGGSIDIAVPTTFIHKMDQSKDNWIRFTLSERKAVRPVASSGAIMLADGRGPETPNGFRYGETEDFFRSGETQGDPGKIVLDKTVITASPTLSIGDTATYQVYIGHSGGSAPATTTMIDQLPAWVAIASLPTVTEINPSAAPLSASFDPFAGPSGSVEWSGSLTPGAMIRIDFDVQVIDCPQHEPGTPAVVTNTAVARQTDGTKITASTDFTVNCDPPTDPEIKLEKFLLDDNDDEVTVSNFLPGESAVFYLHLSSTDGMTRTVQISDTLPSGLVAVATSENFGVTTVSMGGSLVQWTGTIGPANQPAIIKIEVKPTDRISCDDRLVNIATWRTRRGFSGESNPATLVLACRDLGDAPDSTNHYGLDMTAYAGVNGQYPTVFDVTAPERGPMHLIPQPIHLGRGVTAEREADIGFDADGINNLRPQDDRPDLDRRDDGIDYKNLGLNHCEENRMEVRVSISPAAVAYFANNNGKGYLNVWLDGNRDGDWADAETCLFQGDIARIALEHIVIDHEVDVTALGPGLHTIVVPTSGPVNFPSSGNQAEMPSWLRLTLSERPANKTLSATTEDGDVLYGDGRGHDDPFRLGETEDYLVPAPDVQPEPDPVVRKRGVIRLDVDPATGTPHWLTTWIVQYGNGGGAPASNAVVVDEMDAQQTLMSETSVPNTAPTISGNTLTYGVGAIPPAGTIIIRSSADVSLAPGTVLTNSVSISADADSNMANNTAVATVTVPILPPVIVTPVDGTTCEEEVVVTGRAQAGVEVDLYVDGALATTVTADANGDWSTTVTMAPGTHHIHAIARYGSLTSAPSSVITLIVDPTAPWDYQSLRFTRPDGTVIRPSGRLDATGWTIFLRPGQTYTVSLRVCCDDPNAQVTLEIGGQVVILTDDDGDGIYEATFTVEEAGQFEGDVRICVLCNGIQQCTDGTVLIDPEGTVYDSTTGEIIEGAVVTCFEEQNSASGPVFQIWDAAAFGQINPQTVGTDGYYSFFTPAGTFQVDVQKDGYQHYRSPDLVVVDTPVEHDVYLTPIVSASTDETMLISDGGFEPSVLTIKPGQVIEWVNVGDVGHSVANGDDAEVSAQGGSGTWNSGLLQSGSSYKRQFASEGTFTVQDPNNPSLTATVIVTEEETDNPDPDNTNPDSDATTLYLPITQN